MPDIPYQKERTRDNRLQIRKQLLEMPVLVGDFIRSVEDQYTALTCLAYILDLRVFFQYVIAESPQFADKQCRDLTADDMRLISYKDIELFSNYLSLYYTKNQWDQEVINENDAHGKMRKMSALRAFYKYLFAKNVVDGNLPSLIPLPKTRPQPIVYLQPNEVATMLDLVDSGECFSQRQRNYNQNTRVRDIALLSLMLGTGIRVSECVGIDIDDINMDENAFFVTRKGGKGMILYFSEEVAAAISHYMKQRMSIVPLAGHESAFFLSLQRRRITPRAIENLVKKYARVAAPLKKNISPHKLRSTFGTELYKNTGDIYLVADVLGHSDINTTKRHYASMNEEKKRMAAKEVVLRDDG